MSVRLHPDARDELRSLVQFYESEAPGLGRALVREVRAAASRIREFPESGSPGEYGIRRVVLGRFPLTLIYREGDDLIEILAVMHQRQFPDYWRDRR